MLLNWNQLTKKERAEVRKKEPPFTRSTCKHGINPRTCSTCILWDNGKQMEDNLFQNTETRGFILATKEI